MSDAPPDELPIDPHTGLVMDDGWELVASQCTACHSVKLVTQNRGDETYWIDVIRWMQETQNLWPLAPDVERSLVGYLAKHYGPVSAGRRPLLPKHLLPPDVPATTAATTSASADDPRVTKAREALAPLKKELMGKLKAALHEGGPVTAIDVCRVEAPAVAASARAASGIELGRTSHKLRNPTNAPRPWVRPILDDMVASPPAPGTSRTVALAEGKLGYVEPIFVMPLCLQCHGEDVAPEVKAALSASYPEDEATGFAPGAFRGLFWAEVPAR